MGIHEAARQGFDRAANEYHRGRPGYPPECLDFVTKVLRPPLEGPVVEVGAGTGKFTRLLRERLSDVVAVEPVSGMRARFRELLPDCPLHEGTAETLPFADSSVTMIVAAQAFHWFDGPRALSEFVRVLRPGGVLVLVWNVRDESVPWVREMSRIIEPHEGSTPRFRTGAWREAFAGARGLGPLRSREFFHVQSGEEEMMIDRVLSISFISALPEEERAAVAEKVKSLLREHPDLRGRERFAIPYRTEVHWCARIAEGEIG